MIREFYNKHSEKIKKYAPIFIIILAVISIIWSGYRLIRAVWSTERQCYFVNERYVDMIPVETEKFSTEFMAIGKQMLSIDLNVSVTEHVEGTLVWHIEDEKGEPVISEQQQDIADIVTEDMARLSLEVPKDKLNQGQKYILVTSFLDCGDLSLLISDKGLVLTQYFLFSYKSLFTILIVLCSLIGLGMLWIIYKQGLRIRSFIALSLFVGILAVFVIPPASRDDEYRHFIRVYTLARGQAVLEVEPVQPEEFGVHTGGGVTEDYIVTVPNEVNEIRLLDPYANYNDTSYYAELNERLCIDKLVTILQKEPAEGEARVSCVATATRGLVCYWPQVLLVWLGMKLGIRPMILYYLARIGQLLVCVLFGALALKLAPRYKDMIWLLSFIPNTVILKACCNSDGLLIAEMMLLTAVVLWIREAGYDILSRKALWADIAYLILSYHIIKMKVPYALFCIALLLLLTKENIGKAIAFWKKFWKILVPLLTSAVVLVGGWIIWGRGGELLSDWLYAFVPEWHVEYIMDNPRYIAGLFYHTFIQIMKELLLAMNGSNIIPYALVIIVSLLLCKRQLPHWKRGYCAGSFVGLVLLIVLVGYTLTPPDYGSIWGVGYRYLLPFLPIGALALPCGTENTENAVRMVYPAIIVAVQVISLTSWLVWLNKM